MVYVKIRRGEHLYSRYFPQFPTSLEVLLDAFSGDLPRSRIGRLTYVDEDKDVCTIANDGNLFYACEMAKRQKRTLYLDVVMLPSALNPQAMEWKSKEVEKAEAIVFWDIENVQLRAKYTTQTNVDCIQKFTSKFASKCKIEVFLDIKEKCNSRALELCRVHGVSVVAASMKSRRRKHKADAADREMVRGMYEALFRTEKYEVVICITSDRDFLDAFRLLKQENSKRKWILVYLHASPDFTKDEQLWDYKIRIDELFAGVTPDMDDGLYDD